MTVPLTRFESLAPVTLPHGFYAVAGKRLLDVALVLISAPIVVPALVVILLATWIEGGKPLYVQHRVGRDGRVFRCWKVRTMVQDADRALEALCKANPDIAREWSLNQKLARDPRITRLGRFLRRSSLDELPQLWNVLTGTMSLVGPRPFTPDQRAIYAGGRDCSYYRLRPGLSGLWQVSRRNAGTFAERVIYDDAYYLNLGPAQDLRILWQTFAVVLRATGL